MINDTIISKIIKDAMERAALNDPVKSNLYLDEQPKEADDIILAGKQTIYIKQPSIVVFSDDNPLYNWAHECRYLLYNALSGEFIESIDARFPPYMFHIPETYQMITNAVPFSVGVDNHININLWENIEPPFPFYKGERYAVLFSGASEYRHVNDLEYMYRLLTGIYKFSPKNIFVLNYDGTYFENTTIPKYSCPGNKPQTLTWPGDQTAYRMVVNNSGARSSLDGVLNELKSKLIEGDMLFIHTNNHGDRSENDQGVYESCICMYAPPGTLGFYYASEFVAKLAELPKFGELIVEMEQCNSGGFQSPILNNSPAAKTIFIAAAGADSPSKGGRFFDPFTNDWTNYITGLLDTASDTKTAVANTFAKPTFVAVSAMNAFRMASGSVADLDTPVEGDNPPDSGEGMFLGYKTVDS